jgi:hypothetical protein
VPDGEQIVLEGTDDNGHKAVEDFDYSKLHEEHPNWDPTTDKIKKTRNKIAGGEEMEMSSMRDLQDRAKLSR